MAGIPRGAWLCIAALGLFGCATGSSVPSGTLCTIDEDCPRGQTCRDRTCVRDDIDGGPVADRGPDQPVPIADQGVMNDRGPADADPSDGAVTDGAPGGVCTPGVREPCGEALGLCRRGEQLCGPDGQFGPCEGQVGPTDEGCNGADDDCDGQVDEDFDLGAACDGEGACGSGVLECRTARALRCSTEAGGADDATAPEACNGRDDDCDGSIDEDFGAGEPCDGRCGPGVRECSPDEVLVCSTDPEGSEAEGRPEVCDGADNDCDDVVDEGFAVGEGCTAPGACGDGALECDDAGGLRCDSGPGGSATRVAPEGCDGVDEDCDGVIDEGFDIGALCMGELPCGEGLTECAPDGAIRCSTDPGGSAQDAEELCNGLDDDCDGLADEGLPIGEPCPARGACPAGVLLCADDAALICSTHRGGPQDGSSPERCNGVDDDCDGAIDEGQGLGNGCRGQGLCGPGLVECGPAQLPICSTEPGGSADASADEGCNQVDDDCDGRADEGGVCGGEACAGGIGLAPLETALGSTDGLIDDYGRANCLGDAGGPDQVFRFDVDGPGPFAVGVAPLSPDYDPIFWVAADCNGPERCLGPDTQQTREGAGRPEAALLNLIRGGRFVLVVDGRGAGDRGPFAVTVGPADAGEDCRQAVPITVPGRFVGTTARRSGDLAGQACPPGVLTVGPDQVFRFTLDAPTRVRATVTPGAMARPVVSIVRDCGRVDDTCAAAAVADAAGEAVTLEADLEAGDWSLIVDHPVQTGGPFLLEMTTAE